MQTELLFMKDCYIKEFDAKIIDRGPNYVVLDRTAFYPLGGGQPADHGFIDGIRVTNVVKESGQIKHFLERIPEKDEIHAVIDWERRYAHMRMHTAQHLLSAIILDKYGAETAGNQIDTSASRIDFHPLKIDELGLAEITKKFNEIVDKGVPVYIKEMNREDMMASVDERRRKLFSRVPESVKVVRVIEIYGIDKCPCAGTHVANTKEIGHIKITKVENKGKDTIRIRFELEKPKI
jgi:misacylated tRNA(Ala) deacylase